MYKDEQNPGRYRNHAKGIQEGKGFDLDATTHMSVDLFEGDISIHSHATGVGQKKGGNMNADEPSGGDMGHMDDEEMTIIVGKKSRGDVIYTTESKDALGKPLDNPKTYYKDSRDKKGTIEIYNKDNKSKSVQSISGSEAQSILNDYQTRTQ